MRVHGYCSECRRIRRVSVSGHALALARGGVVQGVCAECEQKADEKRRARRGL